MAKNEPASDAKMVMDALCQCECGCEAEIGLRAGFMTCALDGRKLCPECVVEIDEDQFGCHVHQEAE